MALPSFAEPKFTDLVPTLVDESNFKAWASALKWTLNSRDEQYFKLLTGDWPKPEYANPKQPTSAETEARNKWENASHYLLPLINATIHPTIKTYILFVSDAHTAYEILRQAFCSHCYAVGFNKYYDFVNVKYTSNNPRAFANEWRSALSEMQNSNATKLPPLFVFYEFLSAIGNNEEAIGLGGMPPTPENFTETTIGETLDSFVAAEEERIKKSTAA